MLIQHDDLIPVERDLVIGFLHKLRDRQVPAWRRLQAAQALEIYQATILSNSVGVIGRPRPMRVGPKASCWRPMQPFQFCAMHPSRQIPDLSE